MTRHSRLQDGVWVARDALGEISPMIEAGRCPHEERVRLAAMLLRSAAATLEGALTLKDEGGGMKDEDGRAKARTTNVERLEKLHLW